MFNFCDEYLFTKGAVVKNIINGRLYLVISRKEKGETWTCSLREINASETEIIYNKTIVLNFKEDHAKMTRMNNSIYHLVRPAFPKLKDEYSVENGILMKNNEPVSDYSDLLAEYGKTAESVSLRILGVTDISVILDMTDGGEYRNVVGYHPNAPEDRFVSLEEDGYENLYGICLESDKRYLCITAEHPEQIVSRNIDNYEEEVKMLDYDRTDLVVFDSFECRVYRHTYDYLLGKPVFFKGCFIVYQDEENTSLYRVFSFKNRYPKMTEILVTGDIEVISVDADNNGIFIRSAESLFFITSNYEKDLILSSQSRELHKVISQLKGYDHVVDFSVLTVASKDRYSLEAATSNGKTKNLDVYLSYGIYTFNLW